MAERLSWGLAKGGEWRELGWIKLRSVLGDPTKSYVGFFFLLKEGSLWPQALVECFVKQAEPSLDSTKPHEEVMTALGASGPGSSQRCSPRLGFPRLSTPLSLFCLNTEPSRP